MERTVTVTIPRRGSDMPLKVGDKVRLKKSNRDLFPVRIRNKEMVHRMKRKKFVPYFKVVFASASIPGQFNFHIQPANF